MIMHKNLTPERWFTLSIGEQLSNVGADIGRAINWKKKGNTDDSNSALMRGLELLSLTIADPKNTKRLKELIRIKEVLLDYFYGKNQYGYTDEAWNQYFDFYAYLAASQKHSRLCRN